MNITHKLNVNFFIMTFYPGICVGHNFFIYTINSFTLGEAVNQYREIR